jgi:predicted transcriptional regulator
VGLPVIKVRELMTKDPVTTKGDVTLKEAIKSLYEKHIGSIVIVDHDYRPIGIFTERDAIRCIALNKPLDTLLEEEMTKNLITVNDQICFRELRSIYIDKKIRHIPVVDEHNHLEGLLSIREIFDQIFGC